MSSSQTHATIYFIKHMVKHLFSTTKLIQLYKEAIFIHTKYTKRNSIHKGCFILESPV